MKRILQVLIFMSFAHNAYSMVHGNYRCEVEILTGIDDQESKDFGIQNGKVQKSDDYTYFIRYAESALHFVNSGNNAEMILQYDYTGDGFDKYQNSWYTFKVSTSNNDFQFIVNKMNYKSKAAMRS